MSSSSPIRIFVLVLIFNEVTSSTYLDLFIFILETIFLEGSFPRQSSERQFSSKANSKGVLSRSNYLWDSIVWEQPSRKQFPPWANVRGQLSGHLQLPAKKDMLLVCGKLYFALTITKSHTKSQCLKL